MSINSNIKMKLQQLKQGQYIMTLPTKLVKAKGWVKGDSISPVLDGNGDIILKKE